MVCFSNIMETVALLLILTCLSNVSSMISVTTPLHSAIEMDRLDLVKNLLLDEDLDVNAGDALFQTPLHAAACCAKKNYLEASNLILRRGGDVAIEDDEGKTALHWAAMTGKSDLCQLLSSYGANISAVDQKGWTAIHFAAAEGHYATVRWLCENGSPVDPRTLSGATPLMFAVDGEHVAAVNVLIEAGADHKAADASGKTCVMLAREGRSTAQILQSLHSKF
jgi:ankyrin repeat protein